MIPVHRNVDFIGGVDRMGQSLVRVKNYRARAIEGNNRGWEGVREHSQPRGRIISREVPDWGGVRAGGSPWLRGISVRCHGAQLFLHRVRRVVEFVYKPKARVFMHVGSGVSSART